MDALEAVVAELLELARTNSLSPHASNLAWRLHDDRDRAAELLAPALSDPSRAVRHYAITLLSRIERTAPVLRALDDTDESIRLAACSALVGTPTPGKQIRFRPVDEAIRRAVLECLHHTAFTPPYKTGAAIALRVGLYDPEPIADSRSFGS